MTRERDKRYRRNEEIQEGDDFEEADGGPVARLVSEIRDRGYSNKFTLSTQEAIDRILAWHEEAIYARDLEKMKSDTDASK